ncbi:MAG: cyclic nucleotide-binding domain-containing protein [Burkholderiales bacterium]|nr:cyclic nucleotide-binding domain-containing protein [Burkholderiales bacterium]
MNALLPGAIRFDIQTLAQAISNSEASDALRCQFSLPHWTILGAFLQPFPLNKGQILIEQGARDCTLYFIESGTLSAHSEDEQAHMQLALVGAGTVLGEGSFFTHQPRRATVHAASLCKMWCLTPIRFKDLSRHHSPIALELTLAMGSVMAKRLGIAPKRAAVT